MRRIITLFILLDSLVWLGFSALIVFDKHPAFPEDPKVRLIMVVLALGTAVALPLLLFLYRKHKQTWACYLILGVLAIIIFLTVTDEFGLPDLVVLSLHMISFAALLWDRFSMTEGE